MCCVCDLANVILGVVGKPKHGRLAGRQLYDGHELRIIQLPAPPIAQHTVVGATAGDHRFVAAGTQSQFVQSQFVEKKPDVDRNAFPASLCELNDPDLVRRFLSQVMPGDGTVQLDKTFAKFCKQHGWALEVAKQRRDLN